MATIHVSNLSHETSEEEIRQFFSYCGKINELSTTATSKDANAPLSATITFERKPAADTALLLDNTELHGNKVKVEAAASLAELAKGHTTTGEQDEHELRQEDKPRSAVLAEYLSHGYTLADNILQRGIALDQQHGVSEKFKSYLQKFDQKTNAQATARSMDNSYGVSNKAQQGYSVAQRYFERALNTPTGQKVRSFYESGSKTALDIHNEALRLKNMRENKSNCTCQGEPGQCTCEPGTCQCQTCHPGASSGEKAGDVHGIGGGKTQCSCAGNEGKCSCKPGECACSGCNMSEKTA